MIRLLLAVFTCGLALAGCTPNAANAPAPAPAPVATPPEEALAGGPSADAKPPASASANDVSACAAPVSAAGYCGVTTGMTAAQAQAAYPGGLTPSVAADALAQAPDQCFVLFAGKPDKSVSFMVERGQVRRVDIRVGGPFTVDGFGIGTQEGAIRIRHPDAVLSPNRYDDKVTELSYAEGDGKVLFEMVGGKVRAFRAGAAPQVDYVEGCS